MSFPPIGALGERYGPLGTIYFDAYDDMVTYADFPYPYHSGSQFTRSMADSGFTAGMSINAYNTLVAE